MNSKTSHAIAWILVIIGGLNWLLVGLFGWDISQLFGGMDTSIARLIYVLVGLAAIYELATHKNDCKQCGTTSPMSGGTMNR